ncbi:MAG TPA: MarR family transcriptional regulator [Acidimicrobiia bacterium]|jgi:DNA-binding MarR family transcriptional regulator
MSDRASKHGPLGPALRRAWVAYQRQLDDAMADAGFGPRRFPDARVLRMCQRTPEITTSQIGRELGITRQGASKVVASLRERGYVTLKPSPTSGREKIVAVTQRADEYLAAQRKAARAIETRLRRAVGADAFDGLYRLLDAMGIDEDLRMRDYLREMGVREL